MPESGRTVDDLLTNRPETKRHFLRSWLTVEMSEKTTFCREIQLSFGFIGWKYL